MSAIQDLTAKVSAINSSIAQLAATTPPGGMSAADVATLGNALDAMQASIQSLIAAQSPPPVAPPPVPAPAPAPTS